MRIRGIFLGVILVASTIYAGCNNRNNNPTTTQSGITETISREACDSEINAIKTSQNFYKMEETTRFQIRCSKVLKKCNEGLEKLKKNLLGDKFCKALKATCEGT